MYCLERTAFLAEPAVRAFFGEADVSCFVVADGVKGDQAERTGGHAAAAAAAAGGIDPRDIRMAGFQSPRSICFQVNSGFDCVREKG
jgi:hypothetical protein